MTVKDALKGLVAMPVSDELIEKAIIDNDLTATDPYTKELASELDVAGVDVLIAMLTAADISEGGYSVKYKANIEKRILFISSKSGGNPKLDALLALINLQPTVTGASVW